MLRKIKDLCLKKLLSTEMASVEKNTKIWANKRNWKKSWKSSKTIQNVLQWSYFATLTSTNLFVFLKKSTILSLTLVQEHLLIRVLSKKMVRKCLNFILSHVIAIQKKVSGQLIMKFRSILLKLANRPSKHSHFIFVAHTSVSVVL